MLPFASGVNCYFRFRENSFRLRFREPFSLVAKGEIALKPPASQATNAIFYKTIHPYLRKLANSAAFSLLFHNKTRARAQVLFVHTVPALQVIHTHIVSAGYLPQGIVGLYGVGSFAGLGCFGRLVLITILAKTPIRPGSHCPPNCRHSLPAALTAALGRDA